MPVRLCIAAAVVAVTGVWAGGAAAEPGPLTVSVSFNGLTVYTMRADGSEEARFTKRNDLSLSYSPAFSPDGTRVAYVTTRRGFAEVIVVGADGSEPKPLKSAFVLNDDQETIDPAWSPDGKRLAYTGFGNDLAGDIYVSAVDGSAGVVRVTTDPAEDQNPDWSPDGTRLVFQRARGRTSHLFVVNADGSGLVQITSGPGFDEWADWSPDGARIAFQREDAKGTSQLWVVNADGSAPTQLTSLKAGAFGARFSPDGARIAFETATDGQLDVWVMAADGTGQTKLTSSPFDDFSPAWSPDGARIGFVSTRDAGSGLFAGPFPRLRYVRGPAGDAADPSWFPNRSALVYTSAVSGDAELYRVLKDGGRPKNLTRSKQTSDYSPHVSPDGKRVAFVRERNGNPGIALLDVATGRVAMLADTKALEYDPAWSADGQRIAFASNRDGDFELFTVAVAGGRPTQVTRNRVDDAEPTWSPDGRRLAFASVRGAAGSESWDPFVIGVGGGRERALRTTPTFDERFPDWSDDGSLIAWTVVSDFTGYATVQALTPEGRIENILSFPGYGAGYPDWAPAP